MTGAQGFEALKYALGGLRQRHAGAGGGQSLGGGKANAPSTSCPGHKCYATQNPCHLPSLETSPVASHISFQDAMPDGLRPSCCLYKGKGNEPDFSIFLATAAGI